jgi:hypothetical protein
MSTQSCSYGFTPDQSLELDDHFDEVFMPAGDMGADGQVHLELAAGPKCQYGFTAVGPEGLDEHFRAAFPPPADRTGQDGRRHAGREREGCGAA